MREQSPSDPEFENLLRKTHEAAAAGNGKDVTELAIAMLARATQWAMAHPSPEDPIYERARDCEARGDWNEAESSRNVILALALQHPTPGYACKAHWELANHYSARGLTDQALAHSQAALDHARKSDISTLVHMALERQCRTLLQKGNVQAALDAIEEGLSLTPNEPLTSNARARALAFRARCHAKLGRFDDAETSLKEAADILEPPDPEKAMPGARSGMALWWRASSILCAQRNDWAGALKAAEEELTIQRFAVSMPDFACVSTLTALAETLAWLEVCCIGNGFIDQAKEAAAESDRIRAELKLPRLERGSA